MCTSCLGKRGERELEEEKKERFSQLQFPKFPLRGAQSDARRESRDCI